MVDENVKLTPVDLGGLFDDDIGREVAPGVSLVGVEVVMKSVRHGTWWTPGHEVVTLRYGVHGWLIGLQTRAPFPAAPKFDEMRISAGLWPMPGDSDTPKLPPAAAKVGEGITTEVLRAVPLQDARRRVKMIADKLSKDYAPTWDEVTSDGRLTTPEHWAQFAAHYARLVREGERSPIARMARDFDVPRNTISARVRLAREKGLLTRPTKDSPGELTAEATRLLPEKEN